MFLMPFGSNKYFKTTCSNHVYLYSTLSGCMYCPPPPHSLPLRPPWTTLHPTWLSEFSGVVQSCCTLSRSTMFTDVSLIKPEDSQPTDQDSSLFIVIITLVQETWLYSVWRLAELDAYKTRPSVADLLLHALISLKCDTGSLCQRHRKNKIKEATGPRRASCDTRHCVVRFQFRKSSPKTQLAWQI